MPKRRLLSDEVRSMWETWDQSVSFTLTSNLRVVCEWVTCSPQWRLWCDSDQDETAQDEQIYPRWASRKEMDQIVECESIKSSILVDPSASKQQRKNGMDIPEKRGEMETVFWRMVEVFRAPSAWSVFGTSIPVMGVRVSVLTGSWVAALLKAERIWFSSSWLQEVVGRFWFERWSVKKSNTKEAHGGEYVRLLGDLAMRIRGELGAAFFFLWRPRVISYCLKFSK